MTTAIAQEESRNLVSTEDNNKPHMLKHETLKYLRKVSKDFGVKKTILFGSCLYKPEEETGDIDLAVEGIRKRVLYNFVGELLLSKELNKNVDVVDLTDNAPINHIIRDEGVVIYEEKT